MKNPSRVRQRAVALATDSRVILLVYILITVFATVQKGLLGQINNFVVYKTSALNLLQLVDLYGPRYDTFHYSPTFAFFMIPLSRLPDWVGLGLWNLCNSLPLFLAIQRLGIPDRKKALICWIVLWELLTNLQNFQSNGLLAALFLWAFIALERGRSLRAAFLVMLSAFIKVFGLVQVLLALFYPKKVRAALAFALGCVVLALLPGLVIPFGHLAQLYRNWFHHVGMVHGSSYGTSVMGILNAWFGVGPPNLVVQLAGAALLCLPLLRLGRYGYPDFRYRFLASLMIWVVLFNHKAESPTYIIAMVGVAIWFVVQDRHAGDRTLLILALLFTSYYPDLFPRHIRQNYMTPYAVKAVPCLLIWLKVEWELLRRDHDAGDSGASP